MIEYELLCPIPVCDLHMRSTRRFCRCYVRGMLKYWPAVLLFLSLAYHTKSSSIRGLLGSKTTLHVQKKLQKMVNVQVAVREAHNIVSRTTSRGHALAAPTVAYCCCRSPNMHILFCWQCMSGRGWHLSWRDVPFQVARSTRFTHPVRRSTGGKNGTCLLRDHHGHDHARVLLSWVFAVMITAN